MLATPFAVLGAVFLVVGGRSGLSELAFAARAASTQGTVVRLDSWIPGKGDSNTECRAVVSYQVAGQYNEVYGPVQQRPGVVVGWPQAYRVGDVVSILYDPDRPGEAKVDSFYARWAEPLLFSGIGLTFLLVGIGLLWSSWRRWRSQLRRARAKPSAAADRGGL